MNSTPYNLTITTKTTPQKKNLIGRMRQVEISVLHVRHAFRLIPCYPCDVFHGICVIIAKTPFSMWTERTKYFTSARSSRTEEGGHTPEVSVFTTNPSNPHVIKNFLSWNTKEQNSGVQYKFGWALVPVRRPKKFMQNIWESHVCTFI